MNLLTDAWIPVHNNGRFQHICYKDLMCGHDEGALSLPRDDMELAVLQLLASLTQAVLPPKDAAQLRDRAENPMPETDFDKGAEPFLEWFVLDHPRTPFMQTRHVRAKEATPIQKLFIGLPEGNNHAFFNDPGEIRQTCASCSAVALFNQASACPSFGGGFKGGLRGSAPITTLIQDDSLRSCVWKNVLHKGWVDRLLPPDEGLDETPVWIDPIKAGDTYYPHRIGMTKGLFWQPAHIELIPQNETGRCHCCGTTADRLYGGFRKEKFSAFTVKEPPPWPHPHSPRQIGKKEKYLSFTTTAPAWTQLNHFLMRKEEKNEGRIPAPVVSQYREVFARQQRLHLTVGGYRNKQASVLQRRHEFFNLSAGWDDNEAHLDHFVETGLNIKTLLRKKLYGFGKAVGVSGIQEQAERQFYNGSEPVIHAAFREMDWERVVEAYDEFKEQLSGLAKTIFNQLTQPYKNDPKKIKAIAVARRGLFKELNRLD